ncbi:MAG: sigma-70 family RNA polymerase sigma factor [Thermoleophilia bacterium]|nr:sigma-70 family RNA polymerase sigma factor [Thermoleophilia bacterium]
MRPSTVRRRRFEVVFGAELPRLYRAARRHVPSDADAEDLVQETMLRAFRAFDPAAPPENPAAWCQRILLNLAADRARARERRPDPLSVDDEGGGLYDRLEAGRDTGIFSDPQRLVSRWSDRDEVREVMDGLPEWARQVLVLSHVAGLRYQEIADVLEVPVGTVMSRLSRARRALERGLADRAGLPDRSRPRVDAPDPAAQPRLEGLERSWGQVPPAFSALAANPALLDAAAQMMRTVIDDGALSAVVKRRLLAAIDRDDVTDPDPPVALLQEFARKAARAPAELTRADYEILAAEGWTEPQVLEALHLASFAPYLSRMNTALGG